jgi:hypothetical protein
MKMDIDALKKRLQPRSALALTLETDRLAVSLLHREAGPSDVVQSLPVSVGAEDILREPEKAGKQLAESLAAAGIRERRCVVCVPPSWVLTTSTDLLEVSPDDLRSFLELRAEREFSIPVSDLRLAYSDYALPGGKRRATLAAVQSKRIAAVEKMLAAAGCRAVSISLALDKCLPNSADTQPALHFISNGTHTDMVVSAGGGVAALRTFDGPVMTGESEFDAEAFCREIRITLGRLPDALRQQIRTARFSGATASAQRLCLLTRAPLQRLGIASAEFVPAQNEGAAVDAAQSFLNRQPVAFEFVVPEVQKWQVVLQKFDSRRHRWLALAAVGAVLLPLLLFFIRSQIENHYIASWDGMKKNVAELDALQQKIHRYRPWFTPTPQGLQVIEDLVAAFPDQGDVWAKSVQLEQGDKTAKNSPGSEDFKVTCSGFARNEAARLAFLDRLRKKPGVSELQVQQLRGDKPVQFSFTYKWEQSHDK